MSADLENPELREPWWLPAGDTDADWLGWVNVLPFCRDLGLRCEEFTREVAVFRMARPALTPNPNGAVNGGIVVAAADQVMGAMAMRVSEPGQLPATGSLHIQYHRPALAPLLFRATPLGGGRRMKFIEVVVEDADGNRCATSQGTMVAGGSSAVRLT
ncbi:PaaI family thioesterase [Mycolicibacterium pulveris]|uniref:Thioesterase domain-containing protein n=1 Tax=Mycolicibacterium pulveris TaxID=36813 RepID=A0A7I7UFJ6_MYCPV|nr:PaaI family thioesterase [Mycolicibacterium pulveris]MCV6981610.1 PaaI family thioesterase [Mycolicibacterium pulveris]BBY80234.1 hypothetical protein MPUL_13920 [Mycolicibacterium pulveris]